MPPEPFPEFIGQVLQDIMGDLAKLHEIVNRMQLADDPHSLYRTGELNWRDLDALRYTERQLDTKIKYLRGERL